MRRYDEPQYRYNSGFTLVELLTTLCIATILVAIAVPGLSRWVDNAKIQSETTELLESFSLARQYAITARAYVTICGSSQGESCDGGWNKGFLVFIDKSDDNEFINRELTPVLYHYKTNDSFTTQGNIRRFTFRPSGLLKGSSGSLLFCPTSVSAKDYRRIVVSRGGRIRALTAAQVAQKSYLSEMTCG